MKKDTISGPATSVFHPWVYQLSLPSNIAIARAAERKRKKEETEIVDKREANQNHSEFRRRSKRLREKSNRRRSWAFNLENEECDESGPATGSQSDNLCANDNPVPIAYLPQTRKLKELLKQYDPWSPQQLVVRKFHPPIHKY
ncbi:hypothetical protein OROMI_026905 [Orobanche minor]